MSELLQKLVALAKKGQYREPTDTEKLAIQEELLESISQIEIYVNGQGDFFALDEPTRYGFLYLGHLVIRGCPYYHDRKGCDGDVLITSQHATFGRCAKCGNMVSDYEV